jgi:hypothetical protein
MKQASCGELLVLGPSLRVLATVIGKYFDELAPIPLRSACCHRHTHENSTIPGTHGKVLAEEVMEIN